MLALLATALLAPVQDLEPQEGRVLLTDDTPVEGALVLWFQPPPEEIDGVESLDHLPLAQVIATTDAEGRFEVALGDPKGDWWGHFDILSPHGTGFWNPPGSDENTRSDGPISGIFPPESSRVVLAAPLPLELRLLHDGEPVASRDVRLIPYLSWLGALDLEAEEQWPDPSARDLWSAMTSATTDATGRARFPLLPSRDDTQDWALLTDEGCVTFGMPDSQQPVVTLDLATLRHVTLHGLVADEHGRPIAAARVEAHFPDLPWLDHASLPAATTGADGRYRLEGVPVVEGEAALTAKHRTHRSLLELPTLFSDDTETDWDLRLWSTGPVAGQVVDGLGAPVPGIVVEMRRPWSRRGPTVTSDHEGRFDFGTCTAGPYLITTPVTQATRRVYAQDVFASAGEAEVLLKVSTAGLQSSRLEVDFYEEGQDEPLTPQYAMLVPHGFDYSPRDGFFRQVPQDGSVTFTQVPEGEWVLVAGGDALQPIHLPVTLNRSLVPLDVEMRYPQSADLAGKVVYPDGEFHETWVRAAWSPGDNDLGSQHFSWVGTGPGGEFDLGDVYEGQVDVFASADGWYGQARLDLGPLGSERTVIEMQPGARVQLVADAWANNTRFHLELAPIGGGAWTPIQSQDVLSGEKEILTTTIQPGTWRWRVRIEKPGGRLGSQTVCCDIVSGTLEARARETVTVTIPVEELAYPDS